MDVWGPGYAERSRIRIYMAQLRQKLEEDPSRSASHHRAAGRLSSLRSGNSRGWLTLHGDDLIPRCRDLTSGNIMKVQGSFVSTGLSCFRGLQFCCHLSTLHTHTNNSGSNPVSSTAFTSDKTETQP